MKSGIVAAVVFVSAFISSQAANASPIATQVQTRSVANGDTFDFTVISPCVGCVVFTDLMAEAGFPYGRSGFSQFIRFYYSEFGFENVTLDSQYVQVAVQIDPNGNASIPAIVLGNWPSGRRVFFRAGVLDDQGRMIFFTPNRSVEPYRHSVVVQ